jgi:hypothetical protein
MSSFQNIAAAFETTTNNKVKNYLRLALNHIMMDECGLIKKPNPTLMTREEIRAGENEGKIAAIKLYRARLNTSLMEAKTQVETQFSQLGKTFNVWPY